MVEVTVKTEGEKELQRTIDTLVKEFGFSVPQAVKRATLAWLRSMRAATKTAPKLRKIYEPKIDRKVSRFIKHMTFAQQEKAREQSKSWYFKNGGRSRFWWCKSYRKNGKEFQFPIFAKTKEQAMASNKRKIRYSGVAKRSWSWAMADVIGRSSDATGGRIQGAAEARNSGYKTEAAITVKNRVNYILSAFRDGSATTTISRAASKASVSMREYLIGRMKRSR